MKVSPLLAFSFLLALPALAGESCLTAEEAKELTAVRTKLMQAKLSRPDCMRLRGAGSCILPADQANLQYLERKENGDEKACAPDKEESTKDEE